MNRNKVRRTFAAAMSWVYVLSFFGGLVIWLGVNFMPWPVAVAAAAVLDGLFAVALLRSERDYYRDNPDRARREAAFERATPAGLVRRLTNPLTVAASIPGVRAGVRAVTSPRSDTLH